LEISQIFPSILENDASRPWRTLGGMRVGPDTRPPPAVEFACLDLAGRAILAICRRYHRTHRRTAVGFAGCVRARFPHPPRGICRASLIAGHMDTVHPVGVLQRLPWRREGQYLFRARAILDMKGRQLPPRSRPSVRYAAPAIETPLPITMLLDPRRRGRGPRALAASSRAEAAPQQICVGFRSRPSRTVGRP